MCFGHCLSSFLSDVFMSQCAVQASSCLAGSVAGLQSGIFSEFLDTVSGQMVLTADLSGAKSSTSQGYVTNQFVYYVGRCHSPILCVKKLSWSETSLSKGSKYISTVYWVRGWEDSFIHVHVVNLLKVCEYCKSWYMMYVVFAGMDIKDSVGSPTCLEFLLLRPGMCF